MSKKGGRFAFEAWNISLFPTLFEILTTKASTYTLSCKRLCFYLLLRVCLFAYILWGLWNSRNFILFQKTSTSPNEVIQTARRFSKEYKAANSIPIGEFCNRFQRTCTPVLQDPKGTHVQRNALGNTVLRDFNNRTFIQDASAAYTNTGWYPPVEGQLKFYVDTA